MVLNEGYRAKALRTAFYNRYSTFDELMEPGYPAIVVHSESTLIAANQNLADLTGYPMEELEGMNTWLLFPVESVKIITQKLKEKSTEPYQVMSKTKSGELIKVELKGYNFELNGVPLRAVLARLID